jgi:2,3-bisphosphoglycerate-independent phosphoglycerate mutase
VTGVDEDTGTNYVLGATGDHTRPHVRPFGDQGLAQPELAPLSQKELAMQKRRPVMLAVLDGWGWREDPADNAVRQARTPNFDRLWATCPRALLHTSGRDVGLPSGQIGNSEVGHLNIGAGRLVLQDLPRINDAVAAGEIARAPALTALIERLRATGGTCHLLGLVSPGGVHSHQEHAAALARILDAAGVPTVVHAFTDGRDTPPRSAGDDLARLLAALPPSVAIATISGRYYAMDRDKRWERVAKAYLAMAQAEAPRFAAAPAVIAAAYAHDISDEFVVPAVVGAFGGMRDGDGVLCFNFRADRVREILSALLDPTFSGFARPRPLRFAIAAGMTRYSEQLDQWMLTIFPPQSLTNVLGEVVSRAGLSQLRMAETEKYPHVTYFLNGGEEKTYPGEERIMVPSPKVATYDLKPEMSAPELTDRAVEAIGSGKFDLIVLNYANPDMVGHTGSLPAAIAAVETVDAGLGRLAQAIAAAGGALLVTADHGNCELMRDPATGGPHTAHTTNPVPVLLLGGENALIEGRLADVAPTLLELMGLPQPAEMTGKSLLRGACSSQASLKARTSAME